MQLQGDYVVFMCVVAQRCKLQSSLRETLRAKYRLAFDV